MSAVGLPNYGPEGSWWPRSALLPMCTRTILCRPAQRAHSAHRLPSPREGRSSISTPLIGSLRRTYGWFVSVVDLVRNGVDDMRAVYRDHPSGSLTPDRSHCRARYPSTSRSSATGPRLHETHARSPCRSSLAL